MNKNLIIGLIIAAVIVLGGAGYFFMGKSESNPTGGNLQTASVVESKSLKDLFSLGTNQQCTFEDQESGSSGTVYLGRGNARGDFTSDINGQQTASHMILDNESMYVWMDTGNEGFRVNRNSLEQLQENLPDNGPKTVDINKQVDYSCSPWSVDTSMFTPPANVQFTDYSSMMQDAAGIMEQTGEAMQDNTAACAACNNLPTDAQAQCRAALHCN